MFTVPGAIRLTMWCRRSRLGPSRSDVRSGRFLAIQPCSLQMSGVTGAIEVLHLRRSDHPCHSAEPPRRRRPEHHSSALTRHADLVVIEWCSDVAYRIGTAGEILVRRPSAQPSSRPPGERPTWCTAWTSGYGNPSARTEGLPNSTLRASLKAVEGTNRPSDYGSEG